MPIRTPHITRRHLLGGIPALAAMLGSRPVRADLSSVDRRFLFIFADGGWDPTWVFNPAFGYDYVDMPPDSSSVATLGDLRWVSGPGRPKVDEFFANFGQHACIINGLEVRSIAHERCRRMLLTGSTSDADPDIASILAAHAPDNAPLGHVVLSGPAFQSVGRGDILRVGSNGQLAELLDGSCVDRIDHLRLPSDALSELEDAFIADVVDEVAPGSLHESNLIEAYARALETHTVADANSDFLVGGRGDTASELSAAVELLGQGLARCAVVADLGDRNSRWDHHSDLSQQIRSYDMLFDRVGSVCRMLSSRPGLVAPTLLDEVTVVVVSEMGRTPQLNGSMGKDHWMTTSAMMVGGGIAGGQVFGGYNDAMAGELVHPDTGELGATDGIVIQPGHIGATLLHLAGIDPEPHFGADVPPLRGLLA